MKKNDEREKNVAKKKNRKSIKKQFEHGFCSAVLRLQLFLRFVDGGGGILFDSIYSYLLYQCAKHRDRYRVHLNALNVWFAEYVKLEFIRLNKWSLLFSVFYFTVTVAVHLVSSRCCRIIFICCLAYVQCCTLYTTICYILLSIYKTVQQAVMLMISLSLDYNTLRTHTHMHT